MVHLVSTDLNLAQPIRFSFQEVEFGLRGFPKVSAYRIILVYRKRNLTFLVVTGYELVIRTLRFDSWGNTDAKLGCSVKFGQFTTTFQL